MPVLDPDPFVCSQSLRDLDDEVKAEEKEEEPEVLPRYRALSEYIWANQFGDPGFLSAPKLTNLYDTLSTGVPRS